MHAQLDHNLRALSDGDSFLDLTVVDGDTVSQFNIGRQAFYTGDVALYKSEVLVKRFNQFTGTQWSYANSFATPADVEEFNADLVITCVDSAKFRHELGQYFTKKYNETVWIDCGNDSNEGQVILGHLGNKLKDKIPNIYDLYGETLASIEDRPEDSCSHSQSLTSQDFGINHTVAINASNLVWRLLRHGKLSHHGMFIDISTGSVNPLNIDSQVWSSFGYSEAKKH
jgi:PRTRC genetic system ThiF family protein